MFAQKIVHTRPNTSVPFFNAQAVELQDSVFSARVAHPVFKAAFFSISEDKLTYVRVSLFESEASYDEWEDSFAANEINVNFKKAIFANMHNVTCEFSHALSVTEADFADMTKLDPLKTLSENLGVAID